jgi:hypothetical protein
MDSMNSNRASIGSEDRNIADPFIDEGISVEVITGVEPSRMSHDSASSNTMDIDVDDLQTDLPPPPPPERMEGVTKTQQTKPAPTSQGPQNPEMEQRAGLSPFVSAPRIPPAEGKSTSLDMDIPQD